MAWQGIATLLCVLSTWGMLRIFRVQAGESGQAALQAGQMMRRPLLGLAVAGILLTLPFAARPLRFLMGNRVMGWLAAVSMNYYLLHQNLAVAAAIYPAVLWAVPAGGSAHYAVD